MTVTIETKHTKRSSIITRWLLNPIKLVVGMIRWRAEGDKSVTIETKRGETMR